jgi:dihydroorotate dehydrogenase
MTGVYRSVVRPLLFRCDAERVHNQAIALGSRAGRINGLCSLLSGSYSVADPRLETKVAGIRFANPVGLAAGFDKSARAVDFLATLGFGFLEIGSVSADASAGNSRPRLFRLPLDEAIVVNYGVPNDGAEVVAQRVAERRSTIPLGINLVETNAGRPSTLDEICGQFAQAASLFRDRVDYLALNLNCPNTDGGQSPLMQPEHLARLLDVLSGLQNLPPVFLKVTATAEPEKIETLLRVVDPYRFVAGFNFNIPPGKNYSLRTPAAEVQLMPGSLCGRPLAPLIKNVVREWYRRAERGRYSLIGVGGVFTAQDAYELIRHGASLVQLYTALVYHGPGVVRAINQGLLHLLEREGFSSISEAVGTAVA